MNFSLYATESKDKNVKCRKQSLSGSDIILHVLTTLFNATEQYSPFFKKSFHIIQHYSTLFAIIQHCSTLFAIIQHCRALLNII